MSERQEQSIRTETPRLSQVLGAILIAVLVYTMGYTAGKGEGEKIASEEWAAELVNGVFASENSMYIGMDNPEAREDVAEVAKVRGRVESFDVESADRYVGYIVVNTRRKNGGVYKETINLQGGYLQSFSSMPADRD